MSVLSLGEMLKDNPTFRVDAEFFRKELLSMPRFAKRIGDSAFIKSGTTPPDRDDELTHGVVLLKTTDIRNSVLASEDGTEYYRISPEIAARMKETKLCAEDVLLNIVGATTDVIGRVAFVPDGFPEANITQAMALLRVHDPEIKPSVLFAFLAGRYGALQIKRLARPTGQYNLNLQEVASLRIPFFSTNFSEAVTQHILKSHDLMYQCSNYHKQAEQTLLRALALENWQPPEPLTYTRRALEALTTGRLDADYFAPRVTELLQKLGKAGLTIGAVSPTRHERFSPNEEGEFDYIEIGNVRADGTVGAERLPQNEAPSRATSYVRAGDIITSSVRPIRRLSAIIAPEQDGFVCSSGFVVLQPRDVPAEVLLTYLRLPPLCELMDLHTSASLYPAISEADLLALPFHPIARDAEAKIVNAVQSAHTARRQANALLEAAKRAVEIAIEQSEDDAMRFLLESREF